MKIIRDAESFKRILKSADSVMDRSKRFPDNVFQENMKYFLFVTFDAFLLADRFFVHAKQYLEMKAEAEFWVMPIQPDPADYFYKHFKIFNAYEFSRSDSVAEYSTALHKYPKENTTDALAYRSDTILVSSYSGRWAAYGERDLDIAVCAFSSSADALLFRSIYKSEYMADVNWASEFAYQYARGDAGAERARFRKSYSSSI